MTEPPPVLLEFDGTIASVVLNRPDARNAVNLEMCRALIDAFDRIAARPELRVVLIRGNGPVFCAGADLKERMGKEVAWIRARRTAGFAAYRTIEQCPLPVVGLTHGAVVGSGGEIALACDFIITAAGTSFSFPETKWGTVGATQRLQRAIGKRRAKELLYTARAMPAEEAVAVGLAVRLVAPDELLASGYQTAHQISDTFPLSMELTKHVVDLGATTDLESAIEIELGAIDRLLAEGSWRNGLDRFADAHGRTESESA